MRRLPPRILIAAALALAPAALIGAPAAAEEARVDFDAMSVEEREAFGRAVRGYLLENPEVIREAIEELERRRNAAAAVADRELIAAHAEALYGDGFSWVGGNPEGDVTIVEFSDYRCGYCKRAHPHLRQALELDPNVRLIVKEFPILGPDSVVAGRMAMAAAELDPTLYGALNDELMSFQGQLTETMSYRIAAEVGYDVTALKARAQSPEVEDRVRRNYQLADALGIQGTPSFVIGERIVRGFIEVDQMLAAVEDARLAQN